MKESCSKDLANHTGPESCAGARKGTGEALTGVRTGQVLSRESIVFRGADAVVRSGRQHFEHREGEMFEGPARSETLSMYGNTLRENREIPCSSSEEHDSSKGALCEVQGHKTQMYGHGKTDGSVLPTKSLNKGSAAALLAEEMEGRGPAKGNSIERSKFRTQGREDLSQALDRIRQAARADKHQRFTALWHHAYALERLREAYYGLKRKAAAGIDEVTWKEYGEDLDAKLQDLSERLRRGAFRAHPVRRVYIDKATGGQRALGVAALEDKLVQRATAEVLSAIYEEDFVGFSYGFRPGRSPHSALDALSVGIERRKVGWILDLDIRSFFDTLDWDWLIRFVGHRVADRRVVRHIMKWLKAGVLEEGRRIETDEGVIQGGSISPLLANIYLHYVFDLWAEQWRKRHSHGDVIIVRFADDAVVGFQKRADAERFRKELEERLSRFNLSLHPEKTRLLEFGRFAASNRRRRGEGKSETFDFLGFTHICGTSRKGRFAIKRKTARSRLQRKLKSVRADLKRRMNWPVPEVGTWLRSVLLGHVNYYGVPLNYRSLSSFRYGLIRHWYKTLCRRSQRGRITWDRMNRLANKWLPHPRIVHAYPSERLRV